MKNALFSSLALLLLLLLVMPARATAADWPQFKQNAARTGDAADDSLQLPLNRILAVRFPAPIYASPAVVDGKVYIQDAQGHCACLDSGQQNKVLWVTKLAGVANSSSPAIAGKRVFVGSQAGYLAILDAATGELLKKVSSDGGVIAAPAITDDAVYFASTRGYLYKIDFDGNLLWNIRPASACHTEIAVQGKRIAMLCRECHILQDEGSTVRQLGKTPKVRCPTGGPTFIGPTLLVCQGFDSENGRCSVIDFARQKRPFVSFFDDHNDSRVTLSTRAGFNYRGDVCLTTSGKVVWQADCPEMQPGGFHSSPALASNYSVVGTESGRVYFFPLPPTADLPAKSKSRQTAPRIKPAWVFETEGVGHDVNHAVSSSPAVSDGKVYFGGEDGILYGLGKGSPVEVANLLSTGSTGQTVQQNRQLQGHEWHTAAGDMGFSGISPDKTIRPPFAIRWRTRIWSSYKSGPVVADGRVFAAGRMGQLTALDAETGAILWRTMHPYGESRPAPVYSKGKLIVMRGAEDQHRKSNSSGGVWCHDAVTGKLLWRKSLPLGYHFNADGLTADGESCFVCWNGGGGALKAASYGLQDGRTLWEKQYEKLIPGDEVTPIRHSSALGEELLFFSVVDSETLSRKRHLKKEFGATIAVNPKNGDLVWKNTDYQLVRGSRASYRKGALVVFSPDGAHALEAKTGKLLWSSPPPKKLYWGHYYMNALTDEFLQSKGERGLFGYIGCSYPIYVNGLWYGHSGPSAPSMVAWSETASQQAGKAPKQVQKVVWSHRFLSNACPSPAVAYGKLYYVPNGEGVVYCFEQKDAGAKRQ